MVRSRQVLREADDPQARALDDLDDRPRPGPPPRSSRSTGERRQPTAPPGFPACPAEYPERTWRLTKQFVEAGETFGIRRISPWYFAKEFAATIKRDPDVLAFIRANGHDLAEDIFGRMIRLFWRHYIDSGTGKNRALDLFLDEYWSDLFDQAKEEYTTDLIQKDLAAGTLKVLPQQDFHPLLNDAEYQATLQDLRVVDRLTNLQPEEANGNPDRTSTGSRKVRGHGASRRGDSQ